MNTIRLTHVGCLALLIAAMVTWSCSDDDSNPVSSEPAEDLTADCIGCHTDDALLKATALPDEDTSGDDTGEG